MYYYFISSVKVSYIICAACCVQEKEDEEMDSKETRLTLMEEVLLLGLKESNSFTLIGFQYRKMLEIAKEK
jgi:hypothetical protein